MPPEIFETICLGYINRQDWNGLCEFAKVRPWYLPVTQFSTMTAGEILLEVHKARFLKEYGYALPSDEEDLVGVGKMKFEFNAPNAAVFKNNDFFPAWMSSPQHKTNVGGTHGNAMAIDMHYGMSVLNPSHIAKLALHGG